MAKKALHSYGGGSSDVYRGKAGGWREALKEYVEATQGVPEGYKTAAQIAEETGIELSRLKWQLRRAREEGRVETQRVNVDGHWIYVYKD